MANTGDVLTFVATGKAPTYQTPSSGGSEPGTLAYYATSGGSSLSGWLKCDGAVVSQATYPDLYAQMGLINAPGKAWTSTTIDTFNFTTSATPYVSYVNSVYIATIGSTSYYDLATSTDAITWTIRNTGTASIKRGVAFGNSLYACCVTGGLITSTDLVSWTSRAISGATGVQINSVAFGNSVFSVVGGSVMASSTDGVTFSAIPSVPFGGAQAISVIFNGSIFITQGSSICIGTSTDAITWTTGDPGLFSSFGTAIAFGDKFIGVGQSQASPTLLSSTDFNTWTTRNAQTTTTTLNTALFANSIYVIGGNGGVIRSSTDGITWTSRTSGTSSDINVLTYGTVYVLATNGGGISTSTDIITWNARTSNTSSSINALTFGTLYVYAGNGGVLYSSTDATTWDVRTSGTTSTIRCLTYSSALGLYAYCGNGGALATSTDATTWTARTSPFAADGLFSICWGNGLFILGVTAGRIASSTDGITWNAQNTKCATNISTVFYNNNIYYAIAGAANYNILLTSTNGSNWIVNSSQKIRSSSSSGTTTGATSIIYANSLYVVADTMGNISSSTDLITWSVNSSNLTVTASGIAFGNSMFVCVGNAGVAGTSPEYTVATSTDAVTWVPTKVRTGTQPSFTSITYGARFVGLQSATYLQPNVGNYGIPVFMTNTAYTYDTTTQFQLPLDDNAYITLQTQSNFQRALYIKT